MNRLRDEATDDPLSRQGIELLRDTPPAPSQSEMKRRVWNALQRRSQIREPSAFGVRGLRVFATGMTILALAGTAGAVITDRVIVPALERAARSSDGARAERSRAQMSRSARSISAANSAAKTPSTTPPRALPLADAKPALAPPTDDLAVAKARRSRPAATTPQARTQVLDALVALRRDRDPVRAAELLNRYLALPGRGALREEALVLAIEAADARADRVQARRFAQTYLAEYPRGRFGQFARSHAQPQPNGSPSATPTLNLDD